MLDLNGTWLGSYWQLDIPTRFEMTLVQGGNTLSGNILDDGYLGEASLFGEIIGRKIIFVKRYLTRTKHFINYSGIVSEDEQFMQGEWNIGFWSGTWEAHRSEDNLSFSLANLGQKKVPVSLK